MYIRKEDLKLIPFVLLTEMKLNFCAQFFELFGPVKMRPVGHIPQLKTEVSKQFILLCQMQAVPGKCRYFNFYFFLQIGGCLLFCD